jgi:hypothetical protein
MCGWNDGHHVFVFGFGFHHNGLGELVTGYLRGSGSFHTGEPARVTHQVVLDALEFNIFAEGVGHAHILAPLEVLMMDEDAP